MLELILLPCLGMVYHHINQKKKKKNIHEVGYNMERGSIQ